VLAPFGKSENAEFADKNGSFWQSSVAAMRNSSGFEGDWVPLVSGRRRLTG